MASAPQTYKRGSQDIRANQSTFAMFWALTKWSLIFLVILMALMAYFLT